MTPEDAIVHACRRLDRRGLVAGTSGNVSVRLDARRVLATPTGRFKGDLTALDLVTVERGDTGWARPVGVSSEVAMHLAIYDAIPGAGAVVHAHPIVATALASAPGVLDLCVTAEGAAGVGPIVRIGWVRPGGDALARVVAAAACRARVVVMAHHGAVTWDDTVDRALARMESLEHVARIAAHVGTASDARLPRAEVRALRAAHGLDPAAPREAIDLDGIAGCPSPLGLSDSESS